jgi:hypothetical protein
MDMNKTMQYLLLCGGIFALPSLLILGKVKRYRRRKYMSERFDNGMYIKLRESKTALDKASSLIQGTLDTIERENVHKDG